MNWRRLFGPPTPKQQGTADEEAKRDAVKKLEEVEQRLRLIEGEAREARLQLGE